MQEKDQYFSFKFVNKPKIYKEINELGKKACQEHDIPVKLIKSNKYLFSQFIHHNFNNSLFSSNFPSSKKAAADIMPAYKKKDQSDIENYRLISILPTLSKICEICMYGQMDKYFDQIFLKYQCGFC